MSDIQRIGGYNPGGGNWLELLPVDGIAPTTPGSSSITPREGYSWSRIYCTEETMSYLDTVTEADNGDLHTIDIKGFSPGDTPAKAKAIELLKVLGPHVVRFRDNARLTRLVGTATEGLKFVYEQKTGDSVADKRGYALSLSGTLTKGCDYE